MPAPTPTEIKNALIGLRDSAEIAPLGNNLDVVAALLYLQLQKNTSSGGGGDVTVSNFPNNQAISSTDIGIVSEPTAASDSGNFSLIALFKRLLGKIPTPESGRIPVGLSSLPAGSNAIGSITNTTFGSTQTGVWNLANITGTISLPTGAATSAKQPSLGSPGAASADVITVQGVGGGTALNINQISSTATVNITFSNSTTSSTFTIANRLAIVTIPAVTNAPSLVLQVSLDSGATWVNTTVNITTNASNAVVLEADSLAKLSGAFGLSNAFRFNSNLSITSATLILRSIVQ